VTLAPATWPNGQTVPRVDLPHSRAWYRGRGYREPLMEISAHELATYRAEMEAALRARKMARLLRQHPDPQIRWWFGWWAGEAEQHYANARLTRDFGSYGHTCYEA